MADRDSPFERRIVLAHEPPFALGALQVCPPTRELSNATDSTVLEPRVTQVLIALAQARDMIITRDDLIQRCWHGTIVGENAIQRTISRLRVLSASFDGGFEIDTINKVGYRLRVVQPLSAATPPGDRPAAVGTDGEPASVRPSRRAVAGAILGGGAALTLLGGFAWRAGMATAGDRAIADLVTQADLASRADQAESDARAVALLTRATTLAPHRADLWGRLALARWRLDDYGDPALAAKLGNATQDAARRALAIDPRQPDAMASLAMLSPYYGDWLAAGRRMDAVLTIDPGHVAMHDERAFFRVAVGQARSGANERLAFVANDPLNVGQVYRLTYAYWILGRIGDADRNAERAMQLWPTHPGVWFSRLWTLAFTARAERALHHVEDAARRPDFPPLLLETLRAAMTALAGRRPVDIMRAVDRVTADVVASPSGSVNALMVLCGLGALDRAFAVAQAYYLQQGPLIASISGATHGSAVKDQHARKTNMLFVPNAAPMQRDPRFSGLMDAMGLSRYWHDAGVVPDYLAGGAVTGAQT